MPTLTDLPSELHRIIVRAAVMEAMESRPSLHVETARALNATSIYWAMVVDKIIDEELREIEERKAKIWADGSAVEYMNVCRTEGQLHQSLFELNDKRYAKRAYLPPSQDPTRQVEFPSLYLGPDEW